MIQREFEFARHHFEKAAGAGRAPVVHDEVPNGAVSVQSYQLAVLPADVDNGLGFGREMVDAAGMARDLSHRVVGKAQDVTAVSRCHDPRHVAAIEPGFLQ